LIEETPMSARRIVVVLVASAAVALGACTGSANLPAPPATSASPASAPATERVVGPLTPGWFAVRPSGTEKVCKLYAESFRDRPHLERIQAEALVLVTTLFARAPT
jgi:hypothetical protein